MVLNKAIRGTRRACYATRVNGPTLSGAELRPGLLRPRGHNPFPSLQVTLRRDGTLPSLYRLGKARACYPRTWSDPL